MKLHIFSTALFLATSSMLSAQDLSKEITIEKDIVPQERQASRHNVAPAVSLPQVTTKPLGMSENSSAVQVPGLLSALEPAQGESTIGNSPYRGYAGIGYFPHPIFGASAGYRVIANSSTTLDVYGQYNFLSYDATNAFDNEFNYRKSALSIGAFANHKLNDFTTIKASVDYNIYNFTSPTADYTFNQRVNNFNIALGWVSKAGNLDYNIGARYGYFGFAHPDKMNILSQDDYEATNENAISIFGGVALPTDDTSKLGIDLDASFLSYSNDTEWIYQPSSPLFYPMYQTIVDGYTRGAVSLLPHYDYRTDNVDARIGVDASVAINSDKTFSIAPDVHLAWRPTATFGVWAKATGGQELNSYKSLFHDCWAMNPSMANQNSVVNYDLRLGISVGPIKGFAAKIYGGYAATDGWLMPSTFAYSHHPHNFQPVDLKGWHLGASVAYDYKGIATLEVAYEMAPSDYDKGYYAWRDRAKRVLSASLSVKPIEKLQVALSYSLRQDRASYILTPVQTIINSELLLYKNERYDLGDVNSLGIKASYAITKQLSAFVEVSNLLGEDWQDYYMTPTAPVNGLIGIGYKF